jgi:L-alanine-DL-glutamate epimerase-like enolase superfamily enzyme
MARAVRNAGRPGVASYAISAVDCALWDLKARVLGLPLHTLLGRACESVRVYGSGGFTPYDDDRTRRQLAGWVHDQGIPRVKIKIGEQWGTREARDMARMRLARDVIGPDTELYVDANGGYTAKQAIRVADAASDLDIGWIEEPVSSDDLDGLALVRDRVTADVAAGEYGCTPEYFRHMAPYVDCLQADATRCGGVTGWLAAATVANTCHRDISAHCAPTLHTAIAGSAPNLRHLEWFHDHVRVENLLFDGVPGATGGAARPSDAPGLGVVLRTSDAEPYRVR